MRSLKVEGKPMITMEFRRDSYWRIHRGCFYVSESILWKKLLEGFSKNILGCYAWPFVNPPFRISVFRFTIDKIRNQIFLNCLKILRCLMAFFLYQKRKNSLIRWSKLGLSRESNLTSSKKCQVTARLKPQTNLSKCTLKQVSKKGITSLIGF